MMFRPGKIQDNEAGAGAARTVEADIEARFARFGGRGLADAELVAWVLGPGGSPPAAATARALLAEYGLGDLASIRPEALARRPGLGPVRARRLAAAFEMGRRLSAPPERTGLLVRGPEDLHGLLNDEFRGLDRECFLALYLDSRHRVQAVEVVSVGTLNASLVHPREVFKPAVAMAAAALIVAHNHPSGDPRPSGDDMELTARLSRCGDLLGIALLDHLVVGDGTVTSIRQCGWPATD